MSSLAGKVALITGAARGQGRSHAIRLAEEGADIIALDSLTDIATIGYPMASEDDLKETVRLVEALGRRIVSAKVDVRDGAGMTAAVNAGVAELGRLDIVIANAGIVSFSFVEDMSDEMWDDVVDIVLSGSFRTVRAAIPHLKKNEKGGSIVFIGSLGAFKGNRNVAHYSAAKHGLVGMMKCLAIELAENNIRVNTISPTSTDTMMVHNLGSYQLFYPEKDATKMGKEDVWDRHAGKNLLPVAWIDPIDISNAIAWIVSDGARYVTGASLPVDAGASTK
ncbi:mycofactocin-coupled SDR family oxidoreductase [Nocardioides sp. WS12]|uniref:mycofactocin-coupled SDR family oxidoreductase n=1 Tax=Nocardioides sp. WS12 TaxID=2486272 RepID=UPI0015FBEB92|nr:mycofactocin-coupled SDR family oxidoreductase [Nocardioides sp. WS12]